MFTISFVRVNFNAFLMGVWDEQFSCRCLCIHYQNENQYQCGNEIKLIATLLDAAKSRKGYKKSQYRHCTCKPRFTSLGIKLHKNYIKKQKVCSKSLALAKLKVTENFMNWKLKARTNVKCLIFSLTAMRIN